MGNSVSSRRDIPRSGSQASGMGKAPPTDETSSTTTTTEIKVGDSVIITLPQDIVEQMQRGHGGWVEPMAESLNKPGHLLKFDHDGDAVVRFENGKQFVYNPAVLEKATVNLSKIPPCKGDLVRIESSERSVKRLQTGHGGFNDSMKTSLGKIGYVRFVTSQGDIRTKHGPHSWTWNPENVKRLTDADLQTLKTKNQGTRTFNINDVVLIDSNLSRVQRLQPDHGEWVDTMATTLGRYGYVKRVLPDNDLRVKVHGQTWTYNPESVTLIVPARECNSQVQTQTNDTADLFLRLLEALADSSSSTMSTLEAVKAGNVARLRTLLSEKKLDVNEKHESHSLIQIACTLGKFEVVEWLIQEGCDLNLPDSDGDLPIHDAAMHGHPSIVRFLLRSGCDVNARNKKQMTPLHWAVSKGFIMVVKVLVENKASLTVQDEHGDTPLHDAIKRSQLEIAKYLVDQNAVLETRNKRGFNILHWIALKDADKLLEYILEKRELGDFVNEPKEDGFTALHLAALNDHKSCCVILSNLPQTRVNCRNSGGQTPLHLCVIHKSKNALDVFLEIEDVDLNAMDNDGDTALHEAIRHYTMGQLSGFQEVLRSLGSEALSEVSQPEVYAESAKRLVLYGADINQKNNSNSSPLELCLDKDFVDVLQANARQFTANKSSRKRRAGGAGDGGDSMEFTSIVSTSIQRVTSVDEADGDDNAKTNFATNSEDGKANNALPARRPRLMGKKESDVEIKRVQEELNEVKRIIVCPICMDNQFKVIFQCGHVTCEECSDRITECPLCRVRITSRTVLRV